MCMIHDHPWNELGEPTPVYVVRCYIMNEVKLWPRHHKLWNIELCIELCIELDWGLQKTNITTHSGQHSAVWGSDGDRWLLARTVHVFSWATVAEIIHTSIFNVGDPAHISHNAEFFSFHGTWQKSWDTILVPITCFCPVWHVSVIIRDMTCFPAGVFL